MSEAPEPPVTDPVAAAVQGLREAVERLGVVAAPGAGGELWTVPGPDLLEHAVELHRLRCAADAVLHGMVREIDTRGAATAQGAPTTRAWLRERLHLHPGAAKRLTTTARALHDDRSGALVHHAEPDEVPAPGGRAVLAAAFAAGEISGEHAAVACQALAGLPGQVEPEVVAEAETYLCAEAARRDPTVLARLARHLAHVLDPEAGDTLAEKEDHDRATQELHVRQRADGGADVRAHLGAELTAELLSQLQPLAGPRPSCDDRPDLRTVAQRNADALAELLRRSAIAGTTPARHGSRATITVTMALETLQRRLGAPAATLDWSGPISAETARRLACDAQVIPVLLGSCGEPLDVGRASYPVTQAIWRALVARDGGCAFDSCGRPPEWTEAHHRIHWEDGGETSVTNCCLLCDHHHRRVHHHGWDVELINGVIHVIPPPWIDPHRTPRPNQHPDRLTDLHRIPRPPGHTRE
ncbi:MAG TPA: DUF222 domain-containing protein [Marmoricola sp.]|nr:DUF222 domain-containing protein [Marmoricola sp.]